MTKQLAFPKQQLFKNKGAIALAALFVALIVQAFVPILIRAIESDLSPNATMFDRFWVTTAIFGLWEAFMFIGYRSSGEKSVKKGIYTSKIVLLLLAMGILVSVDQILWAWSLTQTKVANSAIAYNFTPLFVILLEWLVWGRRFDRKFVIGTILAILGGCALGVNDFLDSQLYLQGDAIAWLAALIYCPYLMIIEKLRNRLSANTIFLWRCALGTVFTFPLVAIADARLFPSDWVTWLLTIGLAVASVSQLFIAYSLKELSSSFVALVLLIDPVFTAIAAWFVFSENFSLVNWITFAIILFGLYLAISSQSAVKSKTRSQELREEAS